MSNRTQADEESQHAYFKKLKEALERLENNPDFKFLILEEYFVNKPVQIVQDFSTDYTIRKDRRILLTEEMMAISQLQKEFELIKNRGADHE